LGSRYELEGATVMRIGISLGGLILLVIILIIIF
jgi:hypothetical protein